MSGVRSRRERGLDAALLGEQAAAIVGQSVLKNLRWLFRTQPVLDFGVDAHVEKTDDGVPSGRLLALQIKGGPSAFARKRDGGWIFSISDRHAKYWLNHSLPVALVLVNTETGQSYWQHVSAEHLRSSGKNWKIFVPAANTLERALSEWIALVDASADAARENFESNLASLPPLCAEVLIDLSLTDHQSAADAAAVLVGGRSDPNRALEALTSRDELLERGGANVWRAAAHFAQEHGLHGKAAEAFLRTSQLDASRAARALAFSALQLVGTDNDTARERAARAHEIDPAEIAVRVTLAVLALDGSPEKRELLAELATDDDVLALSIRAAYALQHREDEDAIRLYQRVVDARPAASGAQMELARLLLRRSQTPEAEEADLRRGIQLAQSALAQRRRWTSRTDDALVIVVRGLGLDARLPDALESCQPFPKGTATDTEVASAEVARLGLHTARQLGHIDTAVEIAGRVESPADRELLLEEASIPPDARGPLAVSLAERVLTAALAREDWEVVATASVRLAFEGIDRSEVVQAAADAGYFPANYPHLIATIAKSVIDPKGSLPDLRTLAETDLVAADRAIDITFEVISADAALAICRTFRQRYRSQSLLSREVSLLIDLNRHAEAVTEIEKALSSNFVHGDIEVRFWIILGEYRAHEGNWVEAARLFRLAADAKDFDFGSEPSWNLVICQIEQGEWSAARTELDERALDPKSEREISVWLQIHNNTGWTDSTAERAVSLSLRDGLSPTTAAALLSSVIMFTQGVDPTTPQEADSADLRPMVSGTIHAEAFRVIDVLIKRHGDAFGFKKIEFDESSILDELKTLLDDSDRKPIVELVRQVVRGIVPVGMLSEFRSEPYGQVLSRRIDGVRVVSESDATRHDEETRLAGEYFDSPVVVDLSAIEFAIEIDQWDHLRSRFASISGPSSARQDAIRSVAGARNETATRGHMGKGPSGEVGLLEADRSFSVRVLRRAEQVERASRLFTSVRVDRPLVHLQQLDEFGTSPWLESVELAARLGVPLWSDDVGQRRLATAIGVPSFGTVNIVEAIRTQELEFASPEGIDRIVDEQHAFVQFLLSKRAVDQPVRLADLESDVRRTPNALAAAADVLARAAWWAENPSLEPWIKLRAAVAESAPTLWAPWLGRVMTGVAESVRDPEACARLLAVVAALGLSDPLDANRAADCFKIATEIADSYDLADPIDHLAWAASALASINLLDDPIEFVERVKVAASAPKDGEEDSKTPSVP